MERSGPFSESIRQKIHVLILCIFLHPNWINSVFAITGGPSDPVTAQPTALVANDLVDPFTGNIKFSVPLLDLPSPQAKYPFVLEYTSGGGNQTEAEATSVGLGWSFETGRISRSTAGIPDDVSGDSVQQLFHQRPSILIGAGGAIGAEVFGLDSELLSVNTNLGLELFFETYSGYGMALNLSPKASVKLADNLGASLGVNASLNTQQGTTVNANLGLDLGLKDLNPSYGGSFDTKTGLQSAYWGYGSVPLFTPSYIPAQLRSQTGDRQDHSFKIGGEVYGVFIEGRANAYFGTTNYLIPRTRRVYGYLHLSAGMTALTSDDYVQMDFIREKDAPLKPKTPYLPFALLTHDTFEVATSGGPNGSFRAFRNDLTIVGDPVVSSTNISRFAAAEVGLGGYAHGGGSGQGVIAESKSSGWFNNSFVTAATGAVQGNPDFERSYFALTSDLTTELTNASFSHSNEPQFIYLTGATTASSELQELNGSSADVSSLLSSHHRSRSTYIRAVTEAEVDQQEWAGKFKHPGIIRPTNVPLERIAGFDITTADGTHYVFAQPAYVQQEIQCTFSVDPTKSALLAGETTIRFPEDVEGAITAWLANPLASIDFDNIDSMENTDRFLSCTATPRYAHSYHLTSVLSAGYVDADETLGPSEGDLGGHWVRFEYAEKDMVKNYAYRSPYFGAHYDRGYENSYLPDDRASVVFGRKDVLSASKAVTSTHEVIFNYGKRTDALGAASIGQNATSSGGGQALNYVMSMSLYRRGDPLPVTTVKFEYSYELAKGIPNTSQTDPNNNGKLTLKKLWFEYGQDKSGSRSPYEFSYGSTAEENPPYQLPGRHGDQNSDRWGYYQPCKPLPLYGSSPSSPVPGATAPHRCSNGDEPFTTQSSSADANAAAWTLRSIRTPSGAKIDFEIESDDYAYIQSERAAVMVNGCDSQIDIEPSGEAEICVNLSSNGLGNRPTTTEAAQAYLSHLLKGAQGIAHQIPFQAEVLLREGMWETVTGYFEIDMEIEDTTSVSRIDRCNATDCIAYIKVKKAKNKYHPLAFAGWQHLKNNQPQYAVPGVSPVSANESTTAGDLLNTAKGLVMMILKIHDTFNNYNERAAEERWANRARNIKLRLFEPTGLKKGGGARVKTITICDSPPAASVDCTDPRFAIGKSYEYTIEEDGRPISSGVAAYEPSLGGIEISLRRAEFYSDKHILAPSDPAYFEHPIAESLFPAPVVGYRRIVERTLAGEFARNHPNQGIATSGERIYEFYTAKEFPVQVRASIIQKPAPVQDMSLIPGIGAFLDEKFAASSGFIVELYQNTQGLPRSVTEYALRPADGSRVEGADRETRYFYNTFDNNPSDLDPTLPVVYKAGEKVTATFGQRVEYYADMRMSRSSTTSMGVNVNVDTIPAVFFPIPIPVPWPSYDDSVKESRTSTFYQIVHQSAVLVKVEKRDRSAPATTRNIAFDPARGSPVVTSETNAFGDEIYELHVPAYWLHSEMGPLYEAGQRWNLLSADAVVLKSTSNPLEAKEASCCEPEIKMLHVPDVLDASLVLHWNRDLIDDSLLLRSTQSDSEEPVVVVDNLGPVSATFLAPPGKPGMWLPLANFRVETVRVNAAKPSPRTDGHYRDSVTIPVSEFPSQMDPILVFGLLTDSCAPNWVETERFQKYHPRGPAIQSATPLDRIDAVLFGQNASIVQATAQNADYFQVGSESFESYRSGAELHLEDLDDGNIDFWADPHSVPIYQVREIFHGRIKDGLILLDNYVSQNGGDIDPLPLRVRVRVDSYLGEPFYFEPLIVKVVESNNKWIGTPETLLPFTDRAATIDVLWEGKAKANQPKSVQVKPKIPVDEAPRVEITDLAAHTGTRSLAVHGDVAFRQTRLFRKWGARDRTGTYVLSGWVRRENTDVATYDDSNAPDENKTAIGIVIGGDTTEVGDVTGGQTVLFTPSGPIIEGWQKVEGEFNYQNGQALTISFQSGDGKTLYVDDLRIHPVNALLQTFVYEPRTLRLIARLDENNNAVRWQYGQDGQLRFAERETDSGWRTVTESLNHQAETVPAPADNQ